MCSVRRLQIANPKFRFIVERNERKAGFEFNSIGEPIVTTPYRDSDRAATRGHDTGAREKRKKINEGGISTRGTYEIVLSIILGWARLKGGEIDGIYRKRTMK